MQNTIYAFNGSNITFSSGEGNIMVNATEMAKPFNKRPAEFLRLPQTLSFIEVLNNNEPMGKSHRSENGIGTWMSRKLALKFAAWLSPEFENWVYDRIEELFKYGMTATEPTLDAMVNNPDLVIALATQLKQERAEKAHLMEVNGKLQQRTQFVDLVFSTDELITISQAAKLLKLPIGRNDLFKTLREKGILFKNSNEPKQEYVTKGYFEIKEHKIQRPDHPLKIVLQTYVTQKGLAYIAKILGVVIPDTNKIPILNT